MPQINDVTASRYNENTQRITPIDYSAILDYAESIQNRVGGDIPTDSLRADENHLRGIPSDIQEEAVAVIDKICKEVGHKPLSRRLLELCQRISEVAEQHILTKKNKEFEKKIEMGEKVQEQKSLKGWQATTHGVGGFGSAFLGIAGAFIGGAAGKVLGQMSQLARPGIDMFVTSIDGKLAPLSHEQSLFLNSVQSEKQATEGLKNLPEQLRNLILELTRLELRAIESIAQR